jgi:serine/threonine protein kinase
MNFEELFKKFPDIDGIKFISESQLDRSRCTYLLDNVIIKSRRLEDDKTSQLRQNDLEAEYKILRDCAVIDGIPSALYYNKNVVYEILFITYQPGIQLKNLKLSFIEFISVAFRLSKILVRLSSKGISHNDIIPENILIADNNHVSLIDFDQASRHNPMIALLRQFTGINIGNTKLNYSFITIIKDFLRKKFPKSFFMLKKILGMSPELAEHKLPEINNNADPKLKMLLKAWEIAQKSNASSPGLPMAYYEIEFMGYKFPGERSWLSRWERFKSVSDYSGKKIIELGCNMGLLSTFLLKERRALKCIGVDHDSKILESAKIISEVYGVQPEYFQIDFDSKKNWESMLFKFNADIVFALNVLNWVSDKKRFLDFLSNFPEVIFEGHDLPEVEKSRFREIGFTRIEEVGISDRERIILRCRK